MNQRVDMAAEIRGSPMSKALRDRIAAVVVFLESRPLNAAEVHRVIFAVCTDAWAEGWSKQEMQAAEFKQLAARLRVYVSEQERRINFICRIVEIFRKRTKPLLWS